MPGSADASQHAGGRTPINAQIVGVMAVMQGRIGWDMTTYLTGKETFNCSKSSGLIALSAAMGLYPVSNSSGMT
jgi:hypothetical protein